MGICKNKITCNSQLSFFFDFLAGIGGTTITCVLLFALFDIFAFDNLDPISKISLNNSLYPPYSANRSSINLRHTFKHPIIQFFKTSLKLNSVSNELFYVNSLDAYCSNKGENVYTKKIQKSLNINSRKTHYFELLLNRNLNFDQIDVSADFNGYFINNTSADLVFEFGSYKFFYRKLFYRGSFFVFTIAFFIIFLKQSMHLDFKMISCLILVVLASLNNNPIILFFNDKPSTILDSFFRRLFLTSCRDLAAIFLLDSEIISNKLYSVITLFVYLTDLFFGCFADVIFSINAYKDPTFAKNLPFSPFDYVMLSITIVMTIAVSVRAVFRDTMLISLLGYILICLNDFVVFFNSRNMDIGLLYIIGLAIPNIFACDFIGYGINENKQYHFGDNFAKFDINKNEIQFNDIIDVKNEA